MADSGSHDHAGGHERNFFAGMAVAMALVVLAGFARTFFFSFLYDEPAPFAPPETIFYVHGVIAAAWMALLIVQPSLIRQNKIALHRKLGMFGAALAVLIVTVGIWATLVAAARPEGFLGVPVPPLEFLAIIGFNIIMFGVLVGFAIGFRDRGQYHKRLMLLATTKSSAGRRRSNSTRLHRQRPPPDIVPFALCLHPGAGHLGLAHDSEDSSSNALGWRGDYRVTTFALLDRRK
jgi:hypothetical protein